jgi:protein-L-isoaspartate(D-aspartate) O-methyltransferase
MMNDTGLVVGIDIFDEIIEESKKCIKKNNNNLIDDDKIILVKGDGRKGFKRYAPYHVIHAGAAVETIPKEWIDQLACGGRMFIPVGKKGQDQYIKLVAKDSKGVITEKNIMGVRYGYLCTPEEQIKNE